MKNVLVVLAVLCFQMLVTGQDSAHIKIVNLIETGKPTTLSVNGYTFKRGNPMPTGFTTGAFALVPGPHSVTMNNPGAKNPDMEIPLDLKSGETYGVICFSEKSIGKDKDGNPIEVYKLKNTVLEGRDKVGQPMLTVFSLADSEVIEVKIRKRLYRLANKQPTKIDVKLDEVIVFAEKSGKEIESIEIDSPFHYISFISSKADGGFRLTTYTQRNFGVPTFGGDDDEKAEEGE